MKANLRPHVAGGRVEQGLTVLVGHRRSLSHSEASSIDEQRGRFAPKEADVPKYADPVVRERLVGLVRTGVEAEAAGESLRPVFQLLLLTG